MAIWTKRTTRRRNYATKLEQLFVFGRQEPPETIAMNYTLASSKKLYTGTYVWRTRQWCREITACIVELEYKTQSYANFSKTKRRPPMNPPLANRALSLIYVNWDGIIGYTIEPQTHSQPQKFLGRVLGTINIEGNEMSQAVLTSKATTVPRQSFCPLRIYELN